MHLPRVLRHDAAARLPAALLVRLDVEEVHYRHLLGESEAQALRYLARAEKAEADRDEWRGLAQELRVHESRIQGILLDADDSIGSSEQALDAIDALVNGPVQP